MVVQKIGGWWKMNALNSKKKIVAIYIKLASSSRELLGEDSCLLVIVIK
jgi:hypothetical protein